MDGQGIGMSGKGTSRGATYEVVSLQRGMKEEHGRMGRTSGGGIMLLMEPIE
jgi:hypothetical protein